MNKEFLHFVTDEESLIKNELSTYYLLTGCKGHTVKYLAQRFEVRTEFARSVRKNAGLVFHSIARAIRLILK